MRAVAALATGFAVYAWESPIGPVSLVRAASLDPSLVKRGRELAAIGNCVTCHSAPGGKPFAGGLPLETPFGTIYSTNITPDAETGIGRWPETAFVRAMRKGVGIGGEHLYPAFPYDHFTLVSDEDNAALFAYFQSLKPVAQENRANDLPFPFNIRMAVAGWKLLLFREGAYRPDAARSAEWSRGKYLAEGLGHCGACHTPRNFLGAENRGEHFAGAELEGWYAYAINKDSPAPVPWDGEKLAFYLARGFHPLHGVSRGTMASVTANLGTAPQADVAALAGYVASVMDSPSEAAKARGTQALRRAGLASEGEPAVSGETTSAIAGAPSGDSQAVPQGGAANEEGNAIYNAACAICHEAGRALPQGGLNLHLSTAMRGPNPQNVINVTLWGLPAAAGEEGPVMPGFRNALTPEQTTALLTFLRAAFGAGEPPWASLEERVRDTLEGKTHVTLTRSDGTAAAPSDPIARTAPWQ